MAVVFRDSFSNSRRRISTRRDYPELAPVIERGVAVAIDGQIYNNALLQDVHDGAEVYLMPKLRGG